MTSIWKPVLLAAAICGAGLAAPAAEARVVVGVGIGVPLYGPGYWAPYPYGYYEPYRIYAPPPRVVVAPAAPQPAPPAAPDPIFYPKNGQSAAQLETDRRDCNRWATTQPGAMADAGVFQRATFACMEGRGYTVH